MIKTNSTNITIQPHYLLLTEKPHNNSRTLPTSQTLLFLHRQQSAAPRQAFTAGHGSASQAMAPDYYTGESSEVITGEMVQPAPESWRIPEQENYGKWYQKTVEETAQTLSERKKQNTLNLQTLYDLYTNIGQKRKTYEKGRIFGRNNRSFGVLRPSNFLGALQTPLWKEAQYRRYSKITTPLENPKNNHLLSAARNISSYFQYHLSAVICNLLIPQEFIQKLPTFPSKNSRDASIFSHLDIDRSAPFKIRDLELEKISEQQIDEDKVLTVFHSQTGVFTNSRIFLAVDYFVDQFFSTEYSTVEDFLRALAPIHWLLAHLTLFHAGSAACTEIFIQALAFAHGYPFDLRLSGIPIGDTPEDGIQFMDLEAIFTDVETFIEKFPSLVLKIQKD